MEYYPVMVSQNLTIFKISLKILIFHDKLMSNLLILKINFYKRIEDCTFVPYVVPDYIGLLELLSGQIF